MHNFIYIIIAKLIQVGTMQFFLFPSLNLLLNLLQISWHIILYILGFSGIKCDLTIWLTVKVICVQ